MNGNILYIIGVLAMTTSFFLNIDYETSESFIRERPLVSHMMDVDMTNKDVTVTNGLSFGVLYGFETTSAIAETKGADAAVNGMFYNDFGMPLGTIIQDGHVVRVQNLETPMLLIGANNEVMITDVTTEIRAEVNDGYAWLYSVNGAVADGTWGMFSPVYGKTTRVQRPSVNYLIDQGRISEVLVTNAPVGLSDHDYVLTYVGSEQIYDVGDRVSLSHQMDFHEFEVDMGFQTGGWLVRDGLSVAMNYEPFVGYTTAAQPRTLVGVTEENHLLFIVIDGRQQGYSLGASGKEAAQILIDHGCVQGAYLDGGASSTMYYKGKVVNQPSNIEERAVAHAILIFDQ